MIAYLDLPSGLSGDMFLGCLVDAGWPIDRLRAVIAALGLPPEAWSVAARGVQKGLFRATLVEVQAQEGPAHRHLSHVRKIITAADLPPEVKTRAVAVFTRLAEAEAKVHGTTPDKIHFHEVGALDAIIDIVGTVAGVRELGITELYTGAVPLGAGWADTAHGRIPIPAPATLELLAAAHAPLRPNPAADCGELLTPTGAALLAELARFTQPGLALDRVGSGAGRRDCAWPNIARLALGRPVAQKTPGEELPGAGGLVQIETNIDDMNPQLYAAVLDHLLAAGAKDVWLTPVQMKKNRPAVVLSVLAAAAQEAAVGRILLRETTTLGVRVQRLDHRHEARRELRHVETAYGTVRVKLKWVEGELCGATVEYEDCRRLAETAGVALRQVYDAAQAQAQTLLTAAAPPGRAPAPEPEEDRDRHEHAHPHPHPPMP